MKAAVVRPILLAVVLAGWQTAAAITWTGAGGHDWNDPANWDEGRVPGNTDNVFVPSGTPTCEVPQATQIQVQSLTNYGVVTSDGIMYMQTSGDVENHGTMSAGLDNTMDIQAGGDFTNQGNVIAGYPKVSCDNFTNGSSGSFSASTGDLHYATVKCAGDATNAGTMEAGTANSSSTAGWVHVDCGGNFTNTGTAGGGKNYGQGEGGAFMVFCGNFENYGTCSGGNSFYGKGGRATVIASGGAVNGGKLDAGQGNPSGEVTVVAQSGISNEGEVGQGGSRQEPGNVLLAAPMVYLFQVESLQIRSRNLVVVADRIMLGTSGRGPKINAQQDNRFHLTTGGQYMTMEELDTAGVLAGGSNYVFADSVQPPPMGYALAFDPDPIIAGTDTARRSALLSGLEASDSAGASGSLPAWITNLSASPQTVGYSISSVRGWVTSVSGTTSLLDPFALDSFPVAYSIPRGAPRATSDTIVAVITIAPSYSDTERFRFACDKDTFPPGIEETPHRPTGAAEAKAATIIRGVLFLPSSLLSAPSSLLSVDGRKVLALRPGPNDVSRLAPGVYFVRSAVGGPRTAMKVVIQR